jgi:hypothetical protein
LVSGQVVRLLTDTQVQVKLSKLFNEWYMYINQLAYTYQGFPKLIKSCSHFSSTSILPITVNIKSSLYRKVMAKIGYSIQGLVAKVKDTVANG